MATTEGSGRVRGGSPQGSSEGLSSPPRSSPEPNSPSAQFANESMISQSSSITVNPSSVLENSVEKPPRKKPGRKPKQKPEGEQPPPPPPEPPKAKRTRKPREPKDPNAPPIQRRRKNAPAEVLAAVEPKLFPPRQSDGPEQLANFNVPPAPPPAPAPVQANPPQNGNNEDIQQRPIQSFFTQKPPVTSQPQPPPPPPSQQSLPPAPTPAPAPVRTSGQNYDPIRSNYDPVRETQVSHNPYNSMQGSPSHPPSMNRASASPSISSLVDPPSHAMQSPSIATQSFFNQQQSRLQQDHSNSMPPSPTVNRLAPSMILGSSPAISTPPAPAKKIESMPKEPKEPKELKELKEPKIKTTNSSAGASPKPAKTNGKGKDKDESLLQAPPPLPGSGLMQLGPGEGTEFRAPTVILSFPIGGEINKYINFTREAEAQYGWDALHPRLAAQRDRLARVAAIGATLERNGSAKDSGDEMSLDSDGEASNAEMGGMSDGRTGTDGGAKKVPQKRKMKEDEYDKDDGFVDDTDLLWEEQAATVTDGFFVYSGPLVPEGEKPALEARGDGPPKRARGGGRGRGGRGRGGAAAVAAAAVGTRPNGLPISGPGSRGGSTTRKPRITKADRARMEQEKLEREKMGSMTSMPPNYGGMAQLASAPMPQLGSTPMVFNQ